MANAVIKQHVPIFISSTYEDLIPYRDEVQRQLIRLQQIVKGMEYFGSSPQSSLSMCLSQVKESKVFIGIIGMRYGSVEEKSDLSYSQLEYDEAIKNGIPTLIYIMDENHPIPAKYVDTGINAEKLSKFKTILKKRHTVSFFTTPEDLGGKIAQDLVETLSNLEQIEVQPQFTDIKESINFTEIVDKYFLRPAKYKGEEGELYLLIDSSFTGNSLKNEIINKFGLEVGNTISVYGYILNKDKTSIFPDRRISIYADKECADWLENASYQSVIHAKVKLEFCTLKEISRYDGGTVLKDNSYLGLIILKGINIDNGSKEDIV